MLALDPPCELDGVAFNDVGEGTLGNIEFGHRPAHGNPRPRSLLRWRIPRVGPIIRPRRWLVALQRTRQIPLRNFHLVQPFFGGRLGSTTERDSQSAK